MPQFIDVEDKIFGPITTRQFLILLGGGMLVFLAYRFGDFSFFVFSLILIGGLCLLFAFMTVNGQTFHYFLLNIFQTVRKPGLRTWQKSYSDAELKLIQQNYFVPEEPEAAAKKQARPRRIRDLALIVNTGGYYQPDEE